MHVFECEDPCTRLRCSLGWCQAQNGSGWMSGFIDLCSGKQNKEGGWTALLMSHHTAGRLKVSYYTRFQDFIFHPGLLFFFKKT